MVDFDNNVTFDVDLGTTTDIGKNYQPQIDDLKQDVAQLDNTTKDIKRTADKAIIDSSKALSQSASAINSSATAQTTANNAKQIADNAKMIADNASVNANNAQQVADSTKQTVESVKTDLDNKANKSDIPTKVSQLINDNKYVDENQLNNAIIDKADKNEIPKNVSQLVNDSNFITEKDIENKADKIYVDNQLNNKANKTEIPKNTSQLNNDSGYITNVDIENKADKSYVDTQLQDKANKTEVDNALGLKADKTEIPTKVSILENDSKFANETYVNTKIADLVDTAPETLDTLGEIAKALQDEQTATGAIVEELGKKENTVDVDNKLKDKADKTYVDTELNKKADKTTTEDSFTQIDTRLDGVDSSLLNKADKTELPTKLSQLENDKNYPSLYVGEGEAPADTDIKITPNTGILGIPDRTSDLINDSNYVSNYADLPDKPKINGVELVGDKPLSEFEGKYELIEKITLEKDINYYDKKIPFKCKEISVFLTTQPKATVTKEQVNLYLYADGEQSIIAFEKGINKTGRCYSIGRVLQHHNERLLQSSNGYYKTLQRVMQDEFFPEFKEKPITSIRLSPLDGNDVIPKDSIIEIWGVRA